MNILRFNSEKLRKNATVTLCTVLTTELRRFCGPVIHRQGFAILRYALLL